MTIVTDGLHVTSTASVEELHEWARKNNIGRHWFHGLRKGHPHYDLPVRRRGDAIKLKQVSRGDVLAWSQAIGLIYNGNVGGKHARGTG